MQWVAYLADAGGSGGGGVHPIVANAAALGTIVVAACTVLVALISRRPLRAPAVPAPPASPQAPEPDDDYTAQFIAFLTKQLEQSEAGRLKAEAERDAARDENARLKRARSTKA